MGVCELRHQGGHGEARARPGRDRSEPDGEWEELTDTGSRKGIPSRCSSYPPPSLSSLGLPPRGSCGQYLDESNSKFPFYFF